MLRWEFRISEARRDYQICIDVSAEQQKGHDCVLTSNSLGLGHCRNFISTFILVRLVGGHPLLNKRGQSSYLDIELIVTINSGHFETLSGQTRAIKFMLLPVLGLASRSLMYETMSYPETRRLLNISGRHSHSRRHLCMLSNETMPGLPHHCHRTRS